MSVIIAKNLTAGDLLLTKLSAPDAKIPASGQVQLTDWKIDIRSESEAAEVAKKAREALYQIPEVSDTNVELLYDAGYRSAEEIFKNGVEKLKLIPGLDEEVATRLYHRVAEAIASGKLELKPEPTADAGPGGTTEERDGKESDDLSRIPGVGEKMSEALRESGYTNLQQICGAEVSALAEVKGVGPKKAEKIKAEAEKLLEEKG